MEKPKLMPWATETRMITQKAWITPRLLSILDYKNLQTQIKPNVELKIY